MKNKAIKILQYLLLALFVSYYCESTLFIHTHNFNWGKVTHSHPYLPNSSHSHSEAQCLTIASLNNITFTVIAIAAIMVTVRVITLQYVPCIHSVIRYTLRNCSLRAPPVSIC
ncbi:MAG: hypothetical protein RSC28_00540 [Bacteroidales bacterium]